MGCNIATCMAQDSQQGTLDCAPAGEHSSPFQSDDDGPEDSQSVDRPENCHTIADFGGSGQRTLASLEGSN